MSNLAETLSLSPLPQVVSIVTRIEHETGLPPRRRQALLALTAADIPVVPHIDAAILAAIAAGGNLWMGLWHAEGRCGTTHCRGGWAIHLAGERGYRLQERFGPHIAAALIYGVSRPDQLTPEFFCNNTDALANLARCAAADPLPAHG